jgi:hypothetical protein
MTELSISARAILNDVADAMECPDGLLPYEQEILAIGLRAAANQIVLAHPEWLGSPGAVWFQERLRFVSLEIRIALVAERTNP